MMGFYPYLVSKETHEYRVEDIFARRTCTTCVLWKNVEIDLILFLIQVPRQPTCGPVYIHCIKNKIESTLTISSNKRIKDNVLANFRNRMSKKQPPESESFSSILTSD